MQTDSTPAPPVRKFPRRYETVSLGGSTKWRLDALAALGRRSRSATMEFLMDYYLGHHPAVRDRVEEMKGDPHPIQFKNKTAEKATA